MSSAFEAISLTKIFRRRWSRREVRALQNVSFAVEPGSIHSETDRISSRESEIPIPPDRLAGVAALRQPQWRRHQDCGKERHEVACAARPWAVARYAHLNFFEGNERETGICPGARSRSGVHFSRRAYGRVGSIGPDGSAKYLQRACQGRQDDFHQLTHPG